MQKIAAAFIKAKREFQPALKDKTNPAFRSKYADLGACLDAVTDALLNNGIALYQETFLDDSGVTVETVLLHESGEAIRGGKLHVPASKQDPQGYGSALTYCRRYSLQAACGIAPEDDDGAAAVKSTTAARQNTPAPDLSQKNAGQPTSGARTMVSAERLLELESLAHLLKEFVREESDVAIYESLPDTMDGDEKVALWTYLDSKERAYIKKTIERLRAEDKK